MNYDLSQLENIRKIDAPEFLFTRIQLRIKVAREQKVTPAVAWSLGVSLLLTISLNIAVISVTVKNQSPEKELAAAMSLMPNNNLYK